MNRLITFAFIFATVLLSDPLRVAVEVPGQDSLIFGTLTLSTDKAEFQSDAGSKRELLFTLPASSITNVQVAGFKEHFLTFDIKKDSEFAKTYAFLFNDPRTSSGKTFPLTFELTPKEDLRSAMKRATEFKAQIEGANLNASKQEQPLPSRQEETGNSNNPATSRLTQPVPAMPQKNEEQSLFEVSNARHLAKYKGFSTMFLKGTSCSLYFFDGLIGYRGGAETAKFKIPTSAIEGAHLKPIQGHDLDVLTIDLNSSGQSDLKALISETNAGNQIVFLVPSSQRWRLEDYFRTHVKVAF